MGLVEQGFSSTFAKILAKNEEKPCFDLPYKNPFFDWFQVPENKISGIYPIRHTSNNNPFCVSEKKS